MFEIGREYTRNEIYDQVGGGKQTYLPTKDGVVVAACLTKEFNPLAPRVVLCGRGKVIASTGERLAQQTHAIPVFLKRDVNRWEYQGAFRSKASFTSGPDFDRLLAGSGRGPEDVTRAVLLEQVHGA